MTWLEFMRVRGLKQVFAVSSGRVLDPPGLLLFNSRDVPLT